MCLWLLAVIAAACQPASAQSVFTGEYMPYNAFDQLKTVPVKVQGGVLNVGFAPGDLALPQQSFIAWITKSANAVSLYYGGFPVKSGRLLIVPVPGKGVRGGQAFGYRGAAIRLLVGRDSTEEDLIRDWKAVHEMVHLALPDVDQSHFWLSEGLAVYIESIARVQAGDLTEEKIWGDFVRDMPQGLPGAGDRGLDFTPSWGRRYWGGAIFCLLADIEIRKRTGNQIGLQQALRGILAAGGTQEEDWTIEQVLSVADKAAGVNVLSELYRTMHDNPSAPDLDALWQDLGISTSSGGVMFDNTAILAPIRQAITARPAGAEPL
ncbi:MAG: hypothetical protein WC807_07945 [Hyphomicrobium sp.]